MKKFVTTFALSVAIIALLPACGGTKKSKGCSPCSKAKQTEQTTKKVVMDDKETYSL